MGRREDIEEQLNKDYQLLKKLEDRLRTEIDPRLELRWTEDINKIEQQIRQREKELKSLSIYSVTNQNVNDTYNYDEKGNSSLNMNFYAPVYGVSGNVQGNQNIFTSRQNKADTKTEEMQQAEKHQRPSSEEIWQDWKEQATFSKSWLTFIEQKTETSDIETVTNSKRTHKIKIKNPGFLKIDLEYLQNRSLILLNSSISQDNKKSIFRYLLCPSLNFAPFSNNCKRCLYLPQSEAEKSKIRFTTKATEDFIAVVLDNIPHLSWLLINKKIPHLTLSEQQLYELWKYLNDSVKDDWRLFYQSFEVK